MKNFIVISVLQLLIILSSIALGWVMRGNLCLDEHHIIDTESIYTPLEVGPYPEPEYPLLPEGAINDLRGAGHETRTSD